MKKIKKSVKHPEKLYQDEEKLTLDVKEAAELIGVGMNTMYILLHSKDFPKIKIGKNYKVIKSKIPEWLEKNIGSEVVRLLD